MEEDLVRALTSCKICVGNKRDFCTTAHTLYNPATHGAQSTHVSSAASWQECTLTVARAHVGVLYLYSCGSCTLSFVEQSAQL